MSVFPLVTRDSDRCEKERPGETFQAIRSHACTSRVTRQVDAGTT
jgi:hypothetical protein